MTGLELNLTELTWLELTGLVDHQLGHGEDVEEQVRGPQAYPVTMSATSWLPTASSRLDCYFNLVDFQVLYFFFQSVCYSILLFIINNYHKCICLTIIYITYTNFHEWSSQPLMVRNHSLQLETTRGSQPFTAISNH